MGIVDKIDTLDNPFDKEIEFIEEISITGTLKINLKLLSIF